MKTELNLLDTLSRDFETEHFPEEDCTIPSSNEPGIRESEVRYFCVLFNRNAPNYLLIRVFTPYVYQERKKKGFGWNDKDGNFFDHCEKPIHDEDEVVVAWKKVPEGFDGFKLPRKKR